MEDGVIFGNVPVADSEQSFYPERVGPGRALGMSTSCLGHRTEATIGP
jgi:hypothetical protein